MSDKQIVSILDRAVAVADPILDIIANSDPLQVKPRTFGRRWWDVIPTRFGDLTATALSVADWPGTGAWEELSMDQRAAWWVRRIGSITSAAPAFPSMFGAWTRKLPADAVLGAASQALVVLAVGREYGIVDRNDQIDLLGAVLFGRDVDGAEVKAVARQELPEDDRKKAVISALREIGVGLISIDKELGARPQPPAALRHLTWIPIVGGAAGYLGERIALRTAVDAARGWIAMHRGTV